MLTFLIKLSKYLDTKSTIHFRPTMNCGLLSDMICAGSPHWAHQFDSSIDLFAVILLSLVLLLANLHQMLLEMNPIGHSVLSHMVCDAM